MTEMNLLKAQEAFSSFLVELAETREKNRLLGLELIQARRDPAIKEAEICDLKRSVQRYVDHSRKVNDHMMRMPKIGRTKIYIEWLRELNDLLSR